MAKKTPVKQLVPIEPPKKPMYVTWSNEQEKAIALSQAQSGLMNSQPIVRSQGSSVFQNIGPGGVSVRDGYNRRDYDTFRREDQLPTTPKETLRAAMECYRTIGIVRNIIDLMADFAGQGIDLNHPNERIEKWYKEWFKRVRGKERSERFLNLLYRAGNVVVKRQTAKLSVSQEEQMRRAQSDSNKPDIDIKPETPVMKREVPWRYTFLNPLAVEVLADELAVFVGEDHFLFGIQIPKSLSRKIKSPKTDVEKGLVSKIPSNVVAAVKSGNDMIPLDPNKIRTFYYKKDDWTVWAEPMVSSILSDLQLMLKMKLADLSALDGAISSIRVWKLGDVENKIIPTDVAINRLSEMLCNNVGGGVMDLVWDAAIDLVETKTDVHQFLGATKYEPVLTAIYAGLGIPPTLTGASKSGGFTNNFISLKTLVERLQYGRDLLTMFWEEEIRMVQKAMGFRFPATLVFDQMTLSDDSAEKQLLINLADRDLISWESVVERFGESPEIEQVRLRRESRKRRDGQLPEKAGPFHTVNMEPEEEGGPAVPVPKGQPGQGRPKNAKDGKKRKQKKVKPRTSAIFFQTMAWAEDAQTTIGQIAGPGYLKSLGKNTMRDLTDEEAQKFEKFKFFTLCQMEQNQKVDQVAVAKAMQGELAIPTMVDKLMKQTIRQHIEKNDKEPTLVELRRYQAGAYALWKGSYDNVDESAAA